MAVSAANGWPWLILGVLGPALFVASFLVQGAIRPGYDPLRHPVSSLALGGSVGLVQSATFVVTWLLLAGYAGALRRAGCGWVTPIFIGVVGVGLVGAGFRHGPDQRLPAGIAGPFRRRHRMACCSACARRQPSWRFRWPAW